MLLLEEIFKNQKLQHSDAFNLKIQRSLSWLKQAVLLDNDLDLKFISLWVAFNALYAADVKPEQEAQSLQQFLSSIFQLDSEHRIQHIVWEKLNPAITGLLDNQYAYQCYWDFQNKKMSLEVCKAQLAQEMQKLSHALQHKHTAELLAMLFNALRTLSRQLLHGGSSYQSGLNREQLHQACQILSAVLPAFLYIALENAPSLDLGSPFYPVAQVS